MRSLACRTLLFVLRHPLACRPRRRPHHQWHEAIDSLWSRGMVSFSVRRLISRRCRDLVQGRRRGRRLAVEGGIVMGARVWPVRAAGVARPLERVGGRRARRQLLHGGPERAGDVELEDVGARRLKRLAAEDVRELAQLPPREVEIWAARWGGWGGWMPRCVSGTSGQRAAGSGQRAVAADSSSGKQQREAAASRAST